MNKSIDKLAPLSRPIILNGDNTLKQAAYAMKTHNAGSILISTPDIGIIGILTDRDLAFLMTLNGCSREVKLSQLVNNKTVITSKSPLAKDIIPLMIEHKIRRIPVIKKTAGRIQKCLGIVSFDDLMREGLVSIEEAQLILNAQLQSPKPKDKNRNRTKSLFRSIDRREHAYYAFLKQIMNATELSRNDARFFTVYLLGTILKRITPQEGRDLVSQLPYLLQAELMDEISDTDRLITTHDLIEIISKRFGKSEEQACVLISNFWRTFQNLISRGEAKQVYSQLPRDMQHIMA